MKQNLVRIVVSTLTIPLVLTTCTPQKPNGTWENNVKELDAAGEMYGSLGLDRHHALPLYTAERDSTGKPIPIDINFVAQCIELYKKYKIAPGINSIITFQQNEWGWEKIEEAIAESAKYLPRVQY